MSMTNLHHDLEWMARRQRESFPHRRVFRAETLARFQDRDESDSAQQSRGALP